jgi:hypothetical protein
VEPIIIVKERRIPTQGEVLVELNQRVEPDTIIAKGMATSQELTELRLHRSLNVEPEDVKNHVLKHKGDIVEKDEVIAIARSFFGRQTRMARSPMDGVIEAFSGSTGRMLIRAHPVPVEVYSHIPGKVKEIFPEEGATVETEGYRFNGLFGVGGEAHGILELAVDSGDVPLTSSDIKTEHSGKVIIGGSVITLDALREAVKQGVKGIIVGGVDQKDLTYFLGYEIGLGVTGSENVGLTLILTEGFGVNPIQDETFNAFKELSGKLACIDGATHIRSRALRPEIIIPL